MQKTQPMGFHQCLVVGDGHPAWVADLDVPIVNADNFDQLDLGALTLVIVSIDDLEKTYRCLDWIDRQTFDVAPFVIATGIKFSAQAMYRGVDLYLPIDMPIEQIFPCIIAAQRRFESAQRSQRRIRNITQKLAKAQSDFDAVDVELAEARKLQKALVNGQTVSFPRGEVSMFTRPQGHISGDLVGHFSAGKDSIGFFAIDVAGHGVTAALLTARIAGMLLGSSPDTNFALRRSEDVIQVDRPSRVVAQMNALLFDDFETDHYFTCILGVLDVNTGKMTFSQAGHPNPILVKNDGTCRSIGLGGLPVGLIPHAEFVDQTIWLSPGDRFVVHSDGISECMEVAGQTHFGETRLKEMLVRQRSIPSGKLFDSIMKELSVFHGRQKFDDDISGLTIDYHDVPKNVETAFRSPELASTTSALAGDKTTA